MAATSRVSHAKSACSSRALESGSSLCASKPAERKIISGSKARTLGVGLGFIGVGFIGVGFTGERKIISGSKARAAGRSVSRHARRNAAEPEPRGSGALTTLAYAPSVPRSVPVPGKLGTFFQGF